MSQSFFEAHSNKSPHPSISDAPKYTNQIKALLKKESRDYKECIDTIPSEALDIVTDTLVQCACLYNEYGYYNVGKFFRELAPRLNDKQHTTIFEALLLSAKKDIAYLVPLTKTSQEIRWMFMKHIGLLSIERKDYLSEEAFLFDLSRYLDQCKPLISKLSLEHKKFLQEKISELLIEYTEKYRALCARQGHSVGEAWSNDSGYLRSICESITTIFTELCTAELYSAAEAEKTYARILGSGKGAPLYLWPCCLALAFGLSKQTLQKAIPNWVREIRPSGQFHPHLIKVFGSIRARSDQDLVALTFDTLLPRFKSGSSYWHSNDYVILKTIIPALHAEQIKQALQAVLASWKRHNHREPLMDVALFFDVFWAFMPSLDADDRSRLLESLNQKVPFCDKSPESQYYLRHYFKLLQQLIPTASLEEQKTIASMLAERLSESDESMTCFALLNIDVTLPYLADYQELLHKRLWNIKECTALGIAALYQHLTLIEQEALAAKVIRIYKTSSYCQTWPIERILFAMLPCFNGEQITWFVRAMLSKHRIHERRGFDIPAKYHAKLTDEQKQSLIPLLLERFTDAWAESRDKLDTIRNDLAVFLEDHFDMLNSEQKDTLKQHLLNIEEECLRDHKPFKLDGLKKCCNETAKDALDGSLLPHSVA